MILNEVRTALETCYVIVQKGCFASYPGYKMFNTRADTIVLPFSYDHLAYTYATA